MEESTGHIRAGKELALPILCATNNAAVDDFLPISATRHGIRLKFAAPEGKSSKEKYENATFFVNMTSASHEKGVNRLVRSQAMKAYHAKRRRKASSDLNVQCMALPHLLYGTSVNNWTHDPFISFPVDLTPNTRELLHYVFTDQRGVVGLYRQIQLGNGLICGASFYQTLANIAHWACMVAGISAGAKKYMFQQEMQHTMRALRLVRKMLVDPKEQLSQGTVSTVTHLLTYAYMNDDMVAASFHLDGLEKIISLRGGIETLEYGVQAYIIWGEVFLAMTLDTKPRFTPPANLYQNTTAFEAPLTPGTISVSKMLRNRFPTLHTHISLFEEVTRFSNLIQTEVLHRRCLERSDCNRYSSLCYRLLSSQQIIDFKDECSVFGEILRLALLIFMLSVWRFVTSTSAESSRSPAQLRKLRSILEEGEIDWGRLGALKAWVIVMGFLQAVKLDDVCFWMLLWKEALQEFENRNDDSVHQKMKRWQCGEGNFRSGCLSMSVPKAVVSIMWMDAIHGTRYREIVGRFGEA